MRGCCAESSGDSRATPWRIPARRRAKEMDLTLAPARRTRKETNHMETPTHTAPPVAIDRLVLHLHAGQEVAECPHCKGELSKKTPIMKGDESEEIRGRHGVIVAMRMATDPRPKCPDCYGRFELVLHLQNSSDPSP